MRPGQSDDRHAALMGSPYTPATSRIAVCPDSELLDFLAMKQRPWGCDVLLSNPPFGGAVDYLEHAWRLGFRLVVLLLEPSFLHSADRFRHLHPRGHLRRIYPIAERLQGMHDAARHRQRRQAGQPAPTALLVRVRCGLLWPRHNYPSFDFYTPIARMPWQRGTICEQCRKPYQPQRSSSRFCSPACKQQAYRNRLSVTTSVTQASSDELFRYVRHADVPRGRRRAGRSETLLCGWRGRALR